MQDRAKFSVLRSALAAPLETRHDIFGVLSLYRHERDSFGPEHLTLLLSVAAALAHVLEGATAPARYDPDRHCVKLARDRIFVGSFCWQGP